MKDIKLGDGFELNITPAGDFEIVEGVEAAQQLAEFLLSLDKGVLYYLTTWPAGLASFRGKRVDSELLYDIADAAKRSLSNVFPPSNIEAYALVDKNVGSTIILMVFVKVDTANSIEEVKFEIKLSTETGKASIRRL